MKLLLFFYTWQPVTSVIKITSTAAKSLTSAGNRLGLKAASYFATELFFFGDIMPWAYSELPVLNEAMLCHHLTAPAMKAADILSNYFQRHANILEKGGTSNTWTLFFFACMCVCQKVRSFIVPFPVSCFTLKEVETCVLHKYKTEIKQHKVHVRENIKVPARTLKSTLPTILCPSWRKLSDKHM